MPQTRYIHPVDDAEAVNIGIPKYRAQIFFDDPAGLFLAISIEAGRCGPGLHYHRSDQIYFLTCWSRKIQLGQELHYVESNSLMIISAGLPYYKWNDGTGVEAHLEMQFPSPQRFGQLGYRVEKAKDVPEDWKTGRRSHTRRIGEAEITHLRSQKIRASSLAEPSSDSPNAQISYSELPPCDSGHPTRMHVFDQYY